MRRSRGEPFTRSTTTRDRGEGGAIRARAAPEDGCHKKRASPEMGEEDLAGKSKGTTEEPEIRNR